MEEDASSGSGGSDDPAPKADDSRPEDDMRLLDPLGVDLQQRIGKGSFTVIFAGTIKHTGAEVAVKFEEVNAMHPKLFQDAKVYQSLARRRHESDKVERCKMPCMHWHGTVGNFRVMVMDLHGPSLEDIFDRCGRKFGNRLTASLGLKILGSVEYLHSKGFIHGDIKPEHIAFDSKDLNQVHLVDFGLAQKHRKANTREHIPFQTNIEFFGDNNFASLNTLNGHQQSRRDDLESVAYVLLYFSTGSLPWKGLKIKTIQDLKSSDNIMSKCNKYLASFLGYARNLAFEQRPSYSLLGSLLCKWERSAFVRSENRRHRTDRSLQQSRLHMLWPLSSLATPNFVPDAPMQTGIQDFTMPEYGFFCGGEFQKVKNISLPEYNFIPDWTFRLHEKAKVTCCPRIAVPA